MILLQSGQTNTVSLTLTEKATLSSPYWLFVFTNPTTNEAINFVAPDVSSYTDRYNEFSITVTGSTGQNLSAGTITMAPTGLWLYDVYEQSSQYNFQVSGTTSKVETGRVTLSAVTTSGTQIYENEDSDGETYYAYTP